MNCRKEWTYDHVNKQLSSSFINGEYRKQREKVLFEEEKTHLPQLKEEAERIIKRNHVQKEISKVEKRIQENHLKEDQLVSTQRYIHRILREEYDILSAKEVVLSRSTKKGHVKKEFVMKCPMDECRGFLNTNYLCGLCQHTICKDCHHSLGQANGNEPISQNEKDNDHKCNPDDVATITELKNTTKPCPKCSCLIYKIDGCDQMFCIQCHTAFSWRTGQIELGVIHNPHYFAALRAGNIQDPRHHQDHGGCGPIPTFYTIRNLFRRENLDIQEQVTSMYQRLSHHRNVTLPRYNRVPDQDQVRVKYLTGEIDEKKFKQHIYVQYQTQLRKREERDIMNSYIVIGEELFRSMKSDNVVSVLLQLKTLQSVTLDEITMIDKKYVHKGIVQPKDI
jgi:hypothetical protein